MPVASGGGFEGYAALEPGVKGKTTDGHRITNLISEHRDAPWGPLVVLALSLFKELCLHMDLPSGSHRDALQVKWPVLLTLKVLCSATPSLFPLSSPSYEGNMTY